MVSDERLAGYLAGEMEASEHAAFEAELLADEEARRELLAQRQLSAGLHGLLAADHERLARAILATTRGLSDEAIGRRVVAQRPPVPRRQVTRRSPAWWLPLAAAAAVVIASFLAWKTFFHHPRTPGESATIAVLTQAANVVWAGESATPQPGRALGPGWLRMKSGAAQIEFSRGARVMLEGPVEFRLVSDNEGFLQRGKVRAHVPPEAHGFTIRGEGFSVVDRGTEFGCFVPETGAAEIHVLAGSVDVQAAGTAPLRLAKAEAVRLSAGKLSAIPARPELFLSDEQIARLAAGKAGGRLAAWRKASRTLSAHPAALVHYDFEQTRGPARHLPNLVPGRSTPASVIDCQPVEGRWPGKGALEFKRPDDRLRFTVPGEFQSLTLLTWVRVDGLPNTQNSLLMGESELPGEVHWFLHRDGSVAFSVIGADGQWHGPHKGGSLREVTGEWLFLAVTFDGATGTVTHYRNGQPVNSQRLEGIGSLRLRKLELGNWGVRPGTALRASKRRVPPVDYVRNFQGRMDEFAILSAPLSAEEIQRLYETGRPAVDAAAPLSK